jgi:hypothetical protein
MLLVRQDLQDRLNISVKSIEQLEPHKNKASAFKIHLINPNQTPIRSKCRPLPWNLKEKVKKAIDEQMQAGLIRASFSAWCSVRVVDKRDGTVRNTVDYKQLNKIIKDDNYPLPSVTELYNRLVKADMFSKIDMKAAYHQIPTDDNSIELTAFICEYGVYEYLSMPIGIKTAPSWFQRFMENVLHEFIERDVLRVYLDDTVLYTNGLKQHYDEPGKENIVADMLSRLPEEDIINDRDEDDYHDMLVANLEETIELEGEENHTVTRKESLNN